MNDLSLPPKMLSADCPNEKRDVDTRPRRSTRKGAYKLTVRSIERILCNAGGQPHALRSLLICQTLSTCDVADVPACFSPLPVLTCPHGLAETEYVEPPPLPADLCLQRYHRE